MLRITSDSKDQFSFVADEFCELVHTNEIAMFATLFVTRSARPARPTRPARPASQKHAEFRHNFSFKRRGSIGSLFRTWFRITKRFRARLHGRRVTLLKGLPFSIVFPGFVYMRGRVTLGGGLPYLLARVTLLEGTTFCLFKPCKRSR